MMKDLLFVAKWLSIFNAIACAVMVLHDTIYLHFSFTTFCGWLMLAVCIGLSYVLSMAHENEPQTNY